MTLKFKYRELFYHGQLIPKRLYELLKDLDSKTSGDAVVVKSNVTLTDEGLTTAFGSASSFKKVGVINNVEGNYIVVSNGNSYRVAEADSPEVDPTPTTYTIAVTVKDEDNTAVSGASVVYTNSTDSTKTYTGTTGQAGGCNITNIPAGSYNITATCTGYVNYASQSAVTVSADGTQSITMTAVEE